MAVGNYKTVAVPHHTSLLTCLYLYLHSNNLRLTNRKVTLTYVDFSKAFDQINHKISFYKISIL